MSMDGRIMIADFGLAKTADEGSVTMTGAFLGTLRYVSPEQAMAKRVRVDHRTDIYSLGATMYELLCFQPAFPGTDDKEVLGAIIARDPPHPRKIHHAVPSELETICLKCLEKSKEARYGDARALADDLRNYIHDLPIVAKRPGPVSRTIKFVKRRRALVIGVAAAVLLPIAGMFSARQMAIRKEAEIERRAAEIQALCESGSYYSGKGKWDLAEAEWRKALELDPNHVQTLLELAHMRLAFFSTMSEEDATQALNEVDELCSRILQIDPTEMRALGYQGVALKRLKRYPEAIEILQRTVDLAPGAFASWSNLGALFAVTHDLVKAEENLRHGAELAGIEQDGYHAAVWRNYAALALHLQDPDTRTYISNAIECLEDDALSWVLRARMRLQLEGEMDAEEALDDAKFADRLANEKDARAKRIRALAHLRNEQYEHAIKQAGLAMDLGDLKVADYLIIAVTEAKRGDGPTARDRLAAAEATWPEDLRNPGEFRATAGPGDLWFDSADELIQLRQEAETAIASASP
jgi:tetratricopeptide (TPR) repeat protein